ncbi:COX3 oxidase, partial [Acromyrmex heyeri]
NLFINFIFNEFKILINHSFSNIIIFLRLILFIFFNNFLGLFSIYFYRFQSHKILLFRITNYLGYFHSSLAPRIEFRQLNTLIPSLWPMADSIYGSTFFIAIGLHGIHVIIGTSFLSICLIRLYNIHFPSYHHFWI